MKPNKRTTASRIEELRFQAANALIQLRELAKTDLGALEVLASELRHHVRGLNHDALENPDHYGKIIRRCAAWPAAVSVDREIQNWQSRFSEKMELGADAPLNYTGKQWSRSTPEISAALRLIDWIERRGDELPPLNRDTAGQWWKHARPMFTQIYGERFENHQLFAKYKRDKNLHPSLKPETWERKNILSKMAQAFHTIARKT
jgi:hypothetical protein